MTPGPAVLLAAGLVVAAAFLALRPRSGTSGLEALPAATATPGREAGPVPRDGPVAAGSPTRLRVLATAGAAVSVALLLPGAFALLAAALTAVLVWRTSAGWEDRSERRRRASLAADAVHVVDLLSAAVSSGASPAHALHEVAALCEGATAEVLGHWSRRLRWGSEPTRVWAEMAAHEEMGRLGQVLHRSATSGAPVAEALERLAADERARHRGEVEARVRQIEVKASAPLGLCLLPAFVLLGIVPLVAGAVTGLVLG